VGTGSHTGGKAAGAWVARHTPLFTYAYFVAVKNVQDQRKYDFYIVQLIACKAKAKLSLY